MLFTILLAIPIWFFTSVFSLFPNVLPSPPLLEALSFAGKSLGSLNSFIPIPTLISVLAVVLLYDLTILTYRFMKFIFSKVPFFN